MRTMTTLLILLVGCSGETASMLPSVASEGRARDTANTFVRAVEASDIPTYARLADPNAATLIDRGWCSKAETASIVQQLSTTPLRTVSTPHGTAFIGWTGKGRNHLLLQVVIGDGQRISSGYTRIRDGSRTAADNSWRVAFMCDSAWSLASVRDETLKPAVEESLSTIDDALLASWYFEGSNDAKRAIKEQLNAAYERARDDRRAAAQPAATAPEAPAVAQTPQPVEARRQTRERPREIVVIDPAATATVAMDTSSSNDAILFAQHLAAARAGNPKEMGITGWWYITETGTAQDCEEGLSWLRKAAAAGDWFATQQLKNNAHRARCP